LGKTYGVGPLRA